MINLGRVRPGSTIYIPFETFAGATGAPITLTGLATSDIQVYKDGGTTQRASASGFTLLDTDGIDFDGITGIHGFSIDLSDNTTADFWASGSRYFVVVSTVTVDSQTMSFIAATFNIGYEGSWIDTYIATLASQTSFTLNAGPAEDDALNGHWAIIHDAASAVQSARVLISDYTGASKTVTLAAGATFTAAAKDNISIMGMAPLQPATVGRNPVVDASGLVDANTVKVGPTGSGTAQTACNLYTEINTVATDTVNAIVAEFGDFPTAAEIATAVYAVLYGTGSDQVTVQVLVSGVGVQGAETWITTDQAGDNRVAGPAFTDSNGEVTFLLTAGNSYFLWSRKDGMGPITGGDAVNPFVAVAD